MNWRVSIRAAAVADLRDARDWYESQRPGLGRAFDAAMAHAFTRLETSPEAFPIYYRDFRRLLTRRFPYKIFYLIQGEAVIVFRVLHGARDHRREI